MIVKQDGVNAVDYHDEGVAPNLARWVGGGDEKIRSTFMAQDVKDTIDVSGVKALLRRECEAVEVRTDGSSKNPFIM